MSARERVSHLYRSGLSTVARAGGWRLPVRFHGHWMWWPHQMWSGFHVDYEPYMADALRRVLRPGAGFVDVGAHFGLWSAWARTLVGPSGIVLACEPSPAFDVLRSHLDEVENVTLLRTAVGSAPGTVSFFAQGTTSSGSIMRSVTEINERFQSEVPITPITVPMTTLDRLIGDRLDRPWGIKIDVEGFEAEVLKGAGRVLASIAVDWIVEIHPPQLKLCGSSEAEVVSQLEAAGYAVTVIDRNPNSLYTIAASRDRTRLESGRTH